MTNKFTPKFMLSVLSLLERLNLSTKYWQIFFHNIFFAIFALKFLSFPFNLVQPQDIKNIYIFISQVLIFFVEIWTRWKLGAQVFWGEKSKITIMTRNTTRSSKKQKRQKYKIEVVQWNLCILNLIYKFIKVNLC